MKFTPMGGQVEVTASATDGHAEIRVADNGDGISPEFLPYVFDRFRQAAGAATRAHSGLGLGLAIVRHLVEAHGGTVRATSGGRGQGATFFVRLPLPAVPPGLVPGRVESRPVSFAELTGVRVAIVEDDADAQELLQFALQSVGASVVCASSVREALLLIDADPPDVLVSDIGMQGEDGYDLMRRVRLREGNGGRRLPSVALTAFASGEHSRRALEAGFDEFLTKPIDPAAVSQTIARLAGRQPAERRRAD
jgi:CheY-like chemotaxis protein